MEDICVSIICNTYNHKSYIKEALDSFLMQKTDFAFEILIHDDASTDGTAQIVLEYAERFPDVIRAIVQQENQYSKGVRISAYYQYPRARGRFIAICEGDDYWIDDHKLQKQVDALLDNPDVDVCAHQSVKTCNGHIEGYIKPKECNCIIPVEDVIIGGGGFVATNSLMFRKEALVSETPMKKIISIDYVIQIEGALRGGMLYLSDCMSAYRLNVPGSWSTRMYNNVQKLVNHYYTVEKMLLCLDDYTEHKYSNVINNKIRINKFESLYLQSNYKEMLQNNYQDLFSKLPFKQRIEIRLKYIISKISSR